MVVQPLNLDFTSHFSGKPHSLVVQLNSAEFNCIFGWWTSAFFDALRWIRRAPDACGAGGAWSQRGAAPLPLGGAVHIAVGESCRGAGGAQGRVLLGQSQSEFVGNFYTKLWSPKICGICMNMCKYPSKPWFWLGVFNIRRMEVRMGLVFLRK